MRGRTLNEGCVGIVAVGAVGAFEESETPRGLSRGVSLEIHLEQGEVKNRVSKKKISRLRDRSSAVEHGNTRIIGLIHIEPRHSDREVRQSKKAPTVYAPQGANDATLCSPRRRTSVRTSWRAER